MGKLVIFDSLTGNTKMLADKIYDSKLLERVEKYIDKSNKIIGNFYCQGKMPLSVK